MRRALVAAAVLITAAAPLSARQTPKAYTVTIDKLKFGPVPASLHVGDTILWVNRDMFLHSATARDGSFDVALPPGKSGRTVLKHPGRIAFICKYHPGMTGTLDVAR